MRRLSIAVAAFGLFACPFALASSSDATLAAIETESIGHGASGAARGEGERPADHPLTTGNPLWGVPISKLSATRDRPLFSASRRPVAPAAPAAPDPTQTVSAQLPPAEKPPFTLVGTIVGADSRIAIVYDEVSKIASGLHEGERASGWTLRAVDPLSATVEESGRVVTLELPRPNDKELPTPRYFTPPSQGDLTRGNSNGL